MLSNQTVEPEPAAPVTPPASDLQVGQTLGELAEAQGAVGHARRSRLRVRGATASWRAGTRAPSPAALHPRTGRKPSR